MSEICAITKTPCGSQTGAIRMVEKLLEKLYSNEFPATVVMQT